MSWRPAGRQSVSELVRFLKADEWAHVNLSARIRSAPDKPRFGQVADGRLWVKDDGGRCSGALFISRYGVVLPAYDPEASTSEDRNFLRKLLVPRRDRIFSMIGTAPRVRDLEERIGESAVDVESYRMLTGGVSPENTVPGPPGLEIRRAGPEDMERLWPLEKAYQLEEVLRPGSVLNDRSGRRHFMETLRDHVVYCAMLDGRPVAKAGTNARGWGWDQIGGVFVLPELRGRKAGQAVMHRLLLEIREGGKDPCLFVKESNPAALALYRNLGFTDKKAFRISYWSH